MVSLRELALKHKTDKAGGRDNPDNHEYCEAYEFFLSGLRSERFFSMLEIGIGGYHFPDRGGESLRMWREYFPEARIFAMDLHPKTFSIPGVRIYQGDQTDRGVLGHIFSAMHGPAAFIVDDASHFNHLTLKTFEICWPHLSPGGVYAIEDVHTSYWADHGYEGGWHDQTVMNVFKSQTDVLNRKHWPSQPPDGRFFAYPDIESIHFFPEIIFIRKKA